MKEVLHGPIHFDEWPEDDKLGFVILHQTHSFKSPEAVFADDHLADILWSKAFPQHRITVVILHHPLFIPVDKDGHFHQYDCRILFRPKKKPLYEYKLMDGGYGYNKA